MNYTTVNSLEVAVPSYLIYKYSNSVLLTALFAIPSVFFAWMGATGNTLGGPKKYFYLHDFYMNRTGTN